MQMRLYLHKLYEMTSWRNSIEMSKNETRQIAKPRLQPKSN